MADTVGAIFDDRAEYPDRLTSQEVLPTSVVQVYRYPPDPTELLSVQRFGSLMPESSARPRKRPLAGSTQDPPNGQYAMASVEGPDAARADGTFRASSKRQRTREASVIRSSGLDGRVAVGEDQVEELSQASQTIQTQGSIHQIADSQKSPKRKRKCAYSIHI